MKKLLFTSCLLSFLISCRKDDKINNEIFHEEDSLSIYTYDTTSCEILNYTPEISLGDTIKINLQFLVINSCGSFNKFIVNGSTTDQEIMIEVKYLEGFCNYSLMFLDTSYWYVPQISGEYLFSFQGNSGTETITIIVN